MAGSEERGVRGMNAPPARKHGVMNNPPVLAGIDWPGPIGVDDAAPMTITRTVVRVIKDWEPPKPKTTPAIKVRGKTLEEAARQLDALPEWGEGGGRLRADRIPAGTSEEVTVTLHANLIKRLPHWVGYQQASKAAQAEWDRMMGNLTKHETRHVKIAIEEANTLAQSLIGEEISKIARMVTDANRAMLDRQVKYDKDTSNGQDEGVTLDISIS